jgi:hypothetical protein
MPDTFNRWTGPGFTAIVDADLVCPKCKKPVRACGTSAYGGVVELSCLHCHAVLYEIEQRRAGQAGAGPR